MVAIVGSVRRSAALLAGSRMSFAVVDSSGCSLADVELVVVGSPEVALSLVVLISVGCSVRVVSLVVVGTLMGVVVVVASSATAGELGLAGISVDSSLGFTVVVGTLVVVVVVVVVVVDSFESVSFNGVKINLLVMKMMFSPT